MSSERCIGSLCLLGDVGQASKQRDQGGRAAGEKGVPVSNIAQEAETAEGK